MAYANRNQVFLVPYGQLIDPHYLNRPVAFVQGPAVGPMNPINGPVLPQLIPFNAAVTPPSDFGLNAAVLAPIEEARSRSLLQLMAEEELVSSLGEEIKRGNAIDKLKQPRKLLSSSPPQPPVASAAARPPPPAARTAVAPLRRCHSRLSFKFRSGSILCMLNLSCLAELNVYVNFDHFCVC